MPGFMALEATGSHYELDLFHLIKKAMLLNKKKYLMGFFVGVRQQEGNGDTGTVLLKSSCY